MNQLQIIQHNGQRVLTTTQLAEAYGTDNKHINDNFQNNRKRYTLGKHFFELKDEELKSFKATTKISGNLKFAPVIYLWTEKGAWMHAKSLNTDKAWEAYEMLVDDYYQVKKSNNVVPLSKDQALVTLLRTTADLVENQEQIIQRIDEVERKVDEQITLHSGEQRKVQKEIAKRVYELAEQVVYKQLGFDGGEVIVPDLEKERKRLFSEIHRTIKDCFAVASYKDVRRSEFNQLLLFIQAWRPKLVA
ncbi:ORF6N domain-containing protein [Aneurinibacillus migulanus]|uniref:ORF6N domain-containing protein n=2 Tax=Aneurinibacillus migulanus TaxID=47500 RepID=UPI0005B76B59|nr:ORF6N domain-containing protein [Aneurinibacillus migulanus]KIV52288.1 antirepressor [Aneurinibacillus migulanus]CEH31221.1 Toxin-antitoxin system, toxin component, Bro fami ly [Aneurinibacillus migulanus]